MYDGGQMFLNDELMVECVQYTLNDEQIENVFSPSSPPSPGLCPISDTSKSRQVIIPIEQFNYLHNTHTQSAYTSILGDI